jgi:hypothetical protein
MPLNARAVVVAVLACAFAAACDDAPATKTTAPSAEAAGGKPKSDVAVLPPNMVAAVSAGKSASMISVHFAPEEVPQVGKPFPVAIAVVPHQPFASVHASFEVPDAMILATGERIETIKDVAPETVISHKLVIQPNQEGVFLVTAAVETEGLDGTVTRIYSIPLIVHPAGARPAAAPAPAPAPAEPAG